MVGSSTPDRGRPWPFRTRQGSSVRRSRVGRRARRHARRWPRSRTHGPTTCPPRARASSGGALLGAEVPDIVEGIAGVRSGWVYLVSAVVGRRRRRRRRLLRREELDRTARPHVHARGRPGARHPGRRPHAERHALPPGRGRDRRQAPPSAPPPSPASPGGSSQSPPAARSRTRRRPLPPPALLRLLRPPPRLHLRRSRSSTSAYDRGLPPGRPGAGRRVRVLGHARCSAYGMTGTMPSRFTCPSCTSLF